MNRTLMAGATLAFALAAAAPADAAIFYLRGTFGTIDAAVPLLVGATAGQVFDARLTIDTAITDSDGLPTIGRYANAATNFEFLTPTFLTRAVEPGAVTLRNNASGPQDRVDVTLGLSGTEIDRGIRLILIDDQGAMLLSDFLVELLGLRLSDAESAGLEFFVVNGTTRSSVFASLSYFSQQTPPPLPPPPPPPPPPPTHVPEPTSLTLVGAALATTWLRRRTGSD